MSNDFKRHYFDMSEPFATPCGKSPQTVEISAFWFDVTCQECIAKHEPPVVQIRPATPWTPDEKRDE